MKFMPVIKPLVRSLLTSLSRAIPLVPLGLAILLLCSTPRTYGQVLTGEIDGTVRDGSAAVVPNATVTITNSSQNLVKRTVKTDGQGEFTAPLLSIGSYSLTVSAPGFKTYTVSDIQVHVGQPSGVPVTLALGEVVQVVNVTASAVAPQLESAASSTLIESEQVTQLPLSSRDYLQLLYLQPGISGGIPGPDDRGNITSSGAVNAQIFSVNGNGTAANDYFVDGADTLKRAGQQPVSFPGVDFIQEVNLQRASYGSEFGGAGAAVVSVQTKSGGTDFHGGAFGFLRNQVFNANSYFNNLAKVKIGAQRYGDFGYFIGGPVWIPKHSDRHNAKTFFFFGQEMLRSLYSVQQTITNIPTVSQRAGNFVHPVCTSYNSSGACATSVNSITSFDPTAQEYLTDIIDKLPLPNSPTDPQGLITQAAGTNNEAQTLIRIDHQFNNKLSVFLRYLDDPFNLVVPNGFQSTSTVPGVATSKMTDGATSWLGHATYVIGTNHVLEGGFATRTNWVTSQAIGFLASANSPDISVKLPYVATLNLVPSLSISGSSYSVNSPYNERNPITQIFLNNTNSLGRQTLKAGINIELETGGSTPNSSINAGTFAFAPGTLPAGGATQFDQAFANFLQGKVATFTQANSNPAGTNSTNIYEGYVQDDFRVSHTITLTAGVRYSYYEAATSSDLPGHPQLPVLNFDPDTYSAANAPTITTSGLICTTAPCVGGKTPNSNYNSLNGIIIGGNNSPFGSTVQATPNKTFAPRAGFTYDLFGNGKSALRGGFGIYYFAVTANQAKFAQSQNPPNVINTTISNTSFGNPGNGIPVLSASPNILTALQVHDPAPYSEQYSLDFQQQLKWGTLIDVGYYGNHGVHTFANIDANQAPPGLYAQQGLISGNVVTAGNTPVLNQIRPYLGYSAITTQANIFMSNYSSLQTSLRQRIGGGGIVTASYTWSNALTNARTPQNSGNLKAEYGRTANDRTNVFNTGFDYPLPFYRSQKGAIGRIVGGFEISGVVSFGSGLFLTAATSGVDPGGVGLLVGPAAGRPDYLSNPNSGAQHAFKQWFNTSAFQLVPTGQFRSGNDRVSNILGPGYQNWDLSVFRNVRIEKGVSIQFRAEAYNAFNRTNFSGVQITLGTTNYGQVTSTGPNRQVQFGTKIMF